MQRRNLDSPPRWFVAIAVITVLPLLAYPLLWNFVINNIVIGIDSDVLRMLIVLLPAYAVATAWISCRVYTERRAVAWLLQAMLILCYMACAWLFFG